MFTWLEAPWLGLQNESAEAQLWIIRMGVVYSSYFLEAVECVGSVHKAKSVCPLPQIFIHFGTVKSLVLMKLWEI